MSVRVDENGKKLNDSFEKRRSEQVRKDLEQKYKLIPAEKQKQSIGLPLKSLNIKSGNVKKQVSTIAKLMMRDYHFQSFTEYRALLNVYGVTVEEVKGEIRGKAYNGLVYSALNKNGEKVGNPFKASLIGRDVGYNALLKRISLSKETLKDKKAYNRAKQIVTDLLKEQPSRKTFEIDLAKNGISVLFRENEDKRIYGVTFIDHQEKTVFNGSRMGKEFSANVFHNLFNGNRSDNSKDKDRNIDSENNYSQEQDNSSESIAGLFAMEQHGDNYEEIAFTNRMKRRRKKPRGPKL